MSGMSRVEVEHQETLVTTKAKAHNVFETLWAFLKKIDGGGGGN